MCARTISNAGGTHLNGGDSALRGREPHERTGLARTAASTHHEDLLHLAVLRKDLQGEPQCQFMAGCAEGAAVSPLAEWPRRSRAARPPQRACSRRDSEWARRRAGSLALPPAELLGLASRRRPDPHRQAFSNCFLYQRSQATRNQETCVERRERQSSPATFWGTEVPSPFARVHRRWSGPCNLSTLPKPARSPRDTYARRPPRAPRAGPPARKEFQPPPQRRHQSLRMLPLAAVGSRSRGRLWERRGRNPAMHQEGSLPLALLTSLIGSRGRR